MDAHGAVSEAVADSAERGAGTAGSSGVCSGVEIAEATANLAGGDIGNGISVTGVASWHDGGAGETVSLRVVQVSITDAVCAIEAISRIRYIAKEGIRSAVSAVWYTGSSATV